MRKNKRGLSFIINHLTTINPHTKIKNKREYYTFSSQKMTFKNKSITEIFKRKVEKFSYPNSTSKGLEISI